MVACGVVPNIGSSVQKRGVAGLGFVSEGASSTTVELRVEELEPESVVPLVQRTVEATAGGR